MIASTEDPFGSKNVVYQYTRAQAIDDGVLNRRAPATKARVSLSRPPVNGGSSARRGPRLSRNSGSRRAHR